MTEFVLDCSIAMGWCFDDQANDATEQALALLRDGTAYVPHVWFLEVANVLLVAERRRRIKKSDSIRFCELINSLPILAEAAPVGWNNAERALALGRQHGLSAYDAAYLDLAMRTGLPLATRDNQLLTACAQAEVRLVDKTQGPA